MVNRMDFSELAIPGLSGFTGALALVAQANGSTTGSFGIVIGVGMLGVSAFSAWSLHKSRFTRDCMARDLTRERIKNDRNERLAKTRIELLKAGYKCDSGDCPITVASHYESAD